jgi:tetratricopeptide (TPR) repeat protein
MRDYVDNTLAYCLDDGTQLLDGPASDQPRTAILRAESAGVGYRPSESPTIRINSVPKVSPAQDLYFQGSFYAGRENKADNQKAIELLEEAVTLDPNHALSQVELARAYGTKFFYFESGNKGLLARSHAALQKAFSIDPNLPQAHEVKGYLLWSPANGFPHEQAIAAIRAALAIDPDLCGAHHRLGCIYFHIGLLDEAGAELRRTLEIDPSNNMARFNIAMNENYAGRYNEALQILRSIPADFNPALVEGMLAWSLINLGRVKEATDLVNRKSAEYSEDEGGLFASLKAILLALDGDAVGAESAIVEANDKGRGFGHFHHAAHNIAGAYAIMKRPTEAVRYLYLTAENGFPCYPLFENDPNLDAIREDPEFGKFLAEQKAQWEKRKSSGL